jgi:hypothetical protein
VPEGKVDLGQRSRRLSLATKSQLLYFPPT